MSMISEQVRNIRDIAKSHRAYVPSVVTEMLTEAADTIESLSSKLQAANMERSVDNGGGWIPCKERLPEEKINPITKDFCEYQVTFKSEDATDIRHYKFGRGHWWNGPGIMDEYVIAWRQNLEPYHEP